jgi:hypothetical protein
MSSVKDLVGSGCGPSPAFTWSWGWCCNWRPPEYKARVLNVKNGKRFEVMVVTCLCVGGSESFRNLGIICSVRDMYKT